MGFLPPPPPERGWTHAVTVELDDAQAKLWGHRSLLALALPLLPFDADARAHGLPQLRRA